MRSSNQYMLVTNKNQSPTGEVLNLFVSKFLKSLQHQPAKPSGIYAYPTVFKLLSALFSLNKREGWAFLRELQELGFIKLVPAHGVRITAEVDENGHVEESGGSRKKS